MFVVSNPQSTHICRVQSCAWRLPKYWPPPLSPPSECVLPPLLVTWRDETSPPCRRVAVTSRHHRGLPSSRVLSILLPFWLSTGCLFKQCPFFTICCHFSFSFMSSFHWVLVACRVYFLSSFHSLLKASLLAAFFNVSGRRFQGSTTRTRNKGRGYTLAGRWGGVGGQYFGRRETLDLPLTV